MSVTKLVCRSAMIAGLLAASTRGDAILTLGLFTSPSDSGAGTPGLTRRRLQPRLDRPDQPGRADADPRRVELLPLDELRGGDRSSRTPPPPSMTPTSTSAPARSSTPTRLTSGNAQAWYNSPNVAGLFGGHPTPGQIASFDATVLQRVQQTFALGGVPVTVTDNPNDQAAHMLSVVSHAVNPSIPNAIGMTDIGGNGFHFIDNSAPHANSVDQLEWIVAHNVAHELMLAFGVPEVHDQTGQYIDSTTGSISMFLNPRATFSAGAAQDLLSRNFLQLNAAMFSIQPQLLDPAPVPEPTTLAAWGLVVVALLAARLARSHRAPVA